MTDDDVLRRLAALKTSPVPALRALWRELYGREAPGHNRRYLESRLAYRIQELAYGGLPKAAVAHLQRLGEQLDGGRPEIRRRRADERPIAGTRLLREWQGVPHEVIVQLDHFEYAGRRYPSLSAVARAITGTQWNGWTFFGLRPARGRA